MFYILVSGKRDFTDYDKFYRFLDDSIRDIQDDIEIVEGGAKGTDALAKRYAAEHGLGCREFPAQWNVHGRAAGPIRNSEMIEYLNGKNCKAVFVWDGKSRGTGDCLRKARKAGIPSKVLFV